MTDLIQPVSVLSDVPGLKIYRMNIQVLKNPDLFRKYYERMSEVRKRKIDQMKPETGKLQSLGAGILLEKGLSSCGLNVAEIQIREGANGKPYLPDFPQIHFNLSHAEHMVLAVFAAVETGCDIEQIREARMKVAKRFFCEEEYLYLENVEEERRKEEFCRLWTLKESFIKTTGHGMKMPLDSFCFRLEKDSVEMIRGEGAKEYQFLEYRFEDYYEGEKEEYRAAVCLKK